MFSPVPGLARQAAGRPGPLTVLLIPTGTPADAALRASGVEVVGAAEPWAAVDLVVAPAAEPLLSTALSAAYAAHARVVGVFGGPPPADWGPRRKAAFLARAHAWVGTSAAAAAGWGVPLMDFSDAGLRALAAPPFELVGGRR